MPILYKHTHRHGHQLDVHRTADLLLRCKFHPRMCGNFRIPSLKEYILIALESRKYSATNSQTYLSPFSEKRRTSCFVLLSLRHHSDKKKQKKLQYLSHHNWWTASKNISIKYPNIFVSAKRKNIFFFSSEEKNTKLWTQKYTLSSQLLGFVGYSAAVFPEIAARSGAFLAYRGPCAVSREGYSGWHRLAMVEWTWCQCWECPIPLPKGYRVQHCQHPGSNHYC